MRLRTLVSIRNLRGKKVLLRAGFDVPFDKQGKIKDDTRIKEALLTIQYLIKKKVKIIIISHNGRPKGKVVKRLKMDEVAKCLTKLLGKKVTKLDDCLGPKVVKEVALLKSGEILLLENLRFHPEEEENDLRFARRLASLAEIYINDAFSNSHRAHASMVGLPKYLPSFAGLSLVKEVNILSKIILRPARPWVAIIGGVKMATKLGVVRALLKRVDFLLLGGALANTILKAQGIAVGHSLIEPVIVKKLKKIEITNHKLKIPVDVVVAQKDTPWSRPLTKAVARVENGEWILDIGTDTLRLYTSIIKEAKTIVWNGPLGLFEEPQFARGTLDIAKALLESKAQAIIGGGETIEAVNKVKALKFKKKKNIFISSGGGAMLKFLEQKTLPAIKPLIRN